MVTDRQPLRLVVAYDWSPATAPACRRLGLDNASGTFAFAGVGIFLEQLFERCPSRWFASKPDSITLQRFLSPLGQTRSLHTRR